jgi:hypothetical protein
VKAETFATMQIVDRFTSSGYSYISPTVDRACIAVPLLGGIKQRIEPYAPPLIQKADLCIDTVYGAVEVRAAAVRAVANSAGTKVLSVKDTARNAVEERALAIRDAVTTTGGKAQKMIGESAIVARVHKTSLAIVDILDMYIDLYLPEPEDRDQKNGANVKTQTELIPRMLYIPFKIPVRMMHISVAKAQNGRDVIQVRIQWASQLTSDQKAKLRALVISKTQAVTDRVSSSSLAITLRQGKQNTFKTLQAALQSIDDGKKALGVRCYILLDRLHVVEMKDWLLKKVGAMQQAAMDGTTDIFAVASQRAHYVTSFVVGQERATDIFTLVGKRLPLVKITVRETASTGALSDDSSQEAEPKTESSTGATEKASVGGSPRLAQVEKVLATVGCIVSD